MPQGISFGVRVVGDWTRSLNQYALMAAAETKALVTEKNVLVDEVAVQVMIDGPYGGCSVDLGDYETVLLFAGGSGITFTLGLLDDIVGRCTRKGRSNGERTRRIEFVWCVRSFGMFFSFFLLVLFLKKNIYIGSIEWFSSALMDIATAASLTTSTLLDLHISIYVTRLCNPEPILAIPNSDVIQRRPSIYRVLDEITSFAPTTSTKSSDPTSSASGGEASSDLESGVESNNSKGGCKISAEIRQGDGGGVAVCASGPGSLTQEAANAVARLQISGKGMRLGGIALHTESFSL